MTTSKRSKVLAVISLLIALIAVAALVFVVLKYRDAQQSSSDSDTPPAAILGSEVGTYYYDANIQEYTLTLNEGHTFALFIKGETFFGTYTLTDVTLTLDFSVEGKKNLTAELSDQVVTLTYDGASYRLLKKVTYAVSFVTNGGSAVPDQPVMNGKTAVKPADPRRVGYAFVGWYEDAAFTRPYAFGAQAVTADITLYARWSTVSEAGEFDVELNENYVGAAAPLTVTTVGGKLFDLPVPTREGYTFGGWWISMADDGEKLTCVYQEGMVLKSEVTLYALWQGKTPAMQLGVPVVNVTASNVSWTAVSGASSYIVWIAASTGEKLVEKQVTTTLLEFDFSRYEAGEYEICVSTCPEDAQIQPSGARRYYINKMLDRVTGFRVIDTMLLFHAVPNATKYLITVECGNADHQHTAFDNGTSTSFHFSDCDMREGGIRFTVTALAPGYASSVSKTFVFEKALAQVQNYLYDAKSETVSWDPVQNAESYMVAVLCTNAAHSHEFFNNGSVTSVSLKACDAAQDGIVVKVYPKTKGYLSPAASEYRAKKKTLATPAQLCIQGGVLTWESVSGAIGYTVRVGETEYPTSEPRFDLSVVMSGVEGSTYTLAVRADGTEDSLWSDPLYTAYRAMSGAVKYADGALYWNPVIGVESFELQVNDGAILTLSGDACFAPITLSRAGENVLKVRFADGTNRSEWMQITVLAHAIRFDTRGGAAVETVYKAAGDTLDLPVTQKEGYVFRSWYNVPEGAAANGLAYTDGTFGETGSLLLYAYFIPASYRVSYDCGESGSCAETFGEALYTKDYQWSVPTHRDASYAFGGWFSEPNGKGLQYTDAYGKSLSPWSDTEGTAVYAYWIDSVLSFREIVRENGVGYEVSEGENVSLVTEVTIPATYRGIPVVALADRAFENCTALKVINLPASLERISTFAGCVTLEAVNVYGGTGYGVRYFSIDGVVFQKAETDRIVFVPTAKTGTYRIPDGVCEIPAYVFANSSLSRIIIPTCVDLIGVGAFANASKLSTVTFESGVEEKPLTVAARAFEGCVALERILLPARLQKIELGKHVMAEDVIDTQNVSEAFVGCTALSVIEIAKGNAAYRVTDGVIYTADGVTLLYCLRVKRGAFDLPLGVQHIAPGAFIGCDGLTSLNFPASLASIGACAFYGLGENLSAVTFAQRASADVTIGAYAFDGCAALAQLSFANGSRITVIGKAAFRGCALIEALTLPTTLTEVGAEAFYGCAALQSLDFAPNGKTVAFGENAFGACISLERVAIPAHVSALPNAFLGCVALQEITVEEKNAYLCVKDGVLYDKAMTRILAYPAKRAQTVFVVSASVTVIGKDVLKDALYLEEIVFEDGEAPLVIEDEAFLGMGIIRLTLPDRPMEIGARAFRNCLKLAYVSVSESVNAESIGEEAFLGCVALCEIYNASALELVAGSEAYGYLAAYALQITVPRDE